MILALLLLMSLVNQGGAGDTAWLVDPSDNLLISGASSQAGEKLTARFKFIQTDHNGCFAEALSDSVTVDLSAGDRSIHSASYNMSSLFSSSPNSQMYLSDVSIEAAVATTRGQSFARANLVRRGGVKCAILSDYVTQQITACLRNSRHFTSIEGPGWVYTIIIPDPAIGVDWIKAIPLNARWRILSIAGILSTDANAGVRFPGYRLVSQPGRTIYEVRIPTAINANTQQTIVAANAPNAQPNFSLLSCLTIPDSFTLLGGAGAQIQSITNGFGPGDQWTTISLNIEEWLDNV